MKIIKSKARENLEFSIIQQWTDSLVSKLFNSLPKKLLDTICLCLENSNYDYNFKNYLTEDLLDSNVPIESYLYDFADIGHNDMLILISRLIANLDIDKKTINSVPGKIINVLKHDNSSLIIKLTEKKYRISFPNKPLDYNIIIKELSEVINSYTKSFKSIYLNDFKFIVSTDEDLVPYIEILYSIGVYDSNINIMNQTNSYTIDEGLKEEVSEKWKPVAGPKLGEINSKGDIELPISTNVYANTIPNDDFVKNDTSENLIMSESWSIVGQNLYKLKMKIPFKSKYKRISKFKIWLIKKLLK